MTINMFELDYSEKTKEIQRWIQTTVGSAGFSDVVIAVSGGIDSAVSLYLAVKALGKDHIYAMLMPYKDLSMQALTDGKIVAQSAGLEEDHVLVRDIGEIVDTGWKTVNSHSGEDFKIGQRIDSGHTSIAKMTAIRKGNIMARVRMILLYDLAKERNALVIGTENKTEYFLGYFTRFGDEASDIEPIRALYKTQVWEMAKYLAVPKEIIEKKPSANLWEEQTDEGEFGFSYTDADRILYLHFEENLPEEGIVALGLDKDVVEKVLGYVQKNDFKHHLPKVME